MVVEAAIASFLQGLGAFGSGLVTLFEQNPIEFLEGALLFFLLLAVFVVVLPLLLPFLAILAAA
jgi:ABC-type microcin C transport system permease subunit YejE